MTKNNDVQTLLSRAYYFLRFRSRTKKEVSTYLAKKANSLCLSQESVKKVLETLFLEGYIDDNKFIQEFIEYRSANKPKGRRALTFELRKKGIPTDQIEEYFNKNQFDEHALLRNIIQKNSHLDFSDEKTHRRFVAKLIRRGFHYSDIQNSIEEQRKKE